MLLIQNFILFCTRYVLKICNRIFANTHDIVQKARRFKIKLANISILWGNLPLQFHFSFFLFRTC